MKIDKLIKMPSATKDLQVSQNRPSGSEIILSRYGNAQQFAIIFNPSMQEKCGANIERSITGTAPTIAKLRQAYREDQVRVWLMIHLNDLNNFSNTKNKMQLPQMEQLAGIIMTDYYFLKASELLLFFYQFKSGKFGQLYGSVEPIHISHALGEFAVYRRDMIFRLENEKRIAENLMRAEEREANAITREQYLRRKFLKTEKKVKIIKKKV